MQPIRVNERARLLKTIAIANACPADLIEGRVCDMPNLAKREKKTGRSVRLIFSLAFLDPALVKAAAEVKLPRGYGLSRLTGPPMAFADQWQDLRLARPV